MIQETGVYVHNYGPYVGEKLIIDTSDDCEISLDFKSLPGLIKRLQEFEKNIDYYLKRDKIKEDMLLQMWEDIEANPEIKEERMKKFQEDYYNIFILEDKIKATLGEDV